MFGSFQFINTSCPSMSLLLNCMVSLSAWKAPLNKMCFYSSYYSHGDRGVLCFHCKKWTLMFFQPYKWTLSTKRGTRPPVGPEMQISEDSNAIKKMYASHLKLIACFRLGASFFSVAIEAGWGAAGAGTMLGKKKNQTIFIIMEAAESMFGKCNIVECNDGSHESLKIR